MTDYAGLDISLRSTHICVIDDDDELFAEGKADSEVEDILAFFDDFDIDVTMTSRKTVLSKCIDLEQ